MGGELVVASQPNGSRAPSSTAAWMDAITPRTMQDAMQLCDFMSKSDLVPATYRGRPANILLAIQLGAAVGFNPAQSLQGIAVVNGKPSLYGDHALATVKVHPEFESCKESQEHEGTPEWAAVCEIKRRNQPVVRRTFSLKEAEKAGLLKKSGPWQDYRARMLQMRARAFAMRDAFPDALVGLSIAEEAMDIPEEVVVTPAAPSQSRTDTVRAALEGQATKNVADVTPPLQQPTTAEPSAQASVSADWLGLSEHDGIVIAALELGITAETFPRFVRDLTGKDHLTKQSAEVVRKTLSARVDARNSGEDSLFETGV